MAFYYGWNKIQTARPTIRFVFCQLSPASYLYCYVLNCTSEISWLILVGPIFSCSFPQNILPQLHYMVYFIYSSDDVGVESLSHLQLFVTLWTAACQASLSFTISQNLLKLMSTELMMPSSHLILCCPLLCNLLFIFIFFTVIACIHCVRYEHITLIFYSFTERLFPGFSHYKQCIWSCLLEVPWYDLNQIPYDYTVEVRNRFKGLDLIDRVPDELWNEVRSIFDNIEKS